MERDLSRSITPNSSGSSTYEASAEERQRHYDKITTLLAFIATLATLSPSKILHASSEENFHRMYTVTVMLAITIWTWKASSARYSALRSAIFSIAKLIIYFSPTLTGPQYLATRLNVLPQSSWVDTYMREPLRLCVGTSLIVHCVLPLLFPAPLIYTIPVQFIALVARVRRDHSAIVCTTTLLSSSVYINKTHNLYQSLSILPHAVLPGLIPVEGVTPLEECKAIVDFAYILVGMVVPSLLLVGVLAGPHMTIAAKTNSVERVLIGALSVVCTLNKDLLVDDELRAEAALFSLLWLQKLILWANFLVVFWVMSVSLSAV